MEGRLEVMFCRCRYFEEKDASTLLSGPVLFETKATYIAFTGQDRGMHQGKACLLRGVTLCMFSKRAARNCTPYPRTIFSSDRGNEFGASIFQSRLAEIGFV